METTILYILVAFLFALNIFTFVSLILAKRKLAILDEGLAKVLPPIWGGINKLSEKAFNEKFFEFTTEEEDE